jgi:branched-chain amino acid transport system ATP-binding protein
VSGLVVDHLFAGYGRADVLHGISISVPSGQIGVVLGANGAGKTTLLRAISGQMPSLRGSISVDDVEIAGWNPAAVLRRGVAHVPQGRGTFPELSVEDNLRVGGLTRPARDVERDLSLWYERLPRLGERRKQSAGSLSGGEQQMLAVARAFMSHPRYVLLDEPSLGLAPMIVEQLFETLQRLQREFGIGMLIVEQNADLALEIASIGFVMETGRIVDHGTAEVLAGHDSIRRAYLGIGHAD